MAEYPARGETGTAPGGSRERGWGSPLPVEYGSLGKYRTRPENGDGATSAPRQSGYVAAGASASERTIRAARSGFGVLRRALRGSSSSSGQPPSGSPSWEDWGVDGRRPSPTAASSAYRSTVRSDGAGTSTGVLRDLARSIAKPSRPAPVSRRPSAPAPAVDGQRPQGVGAADQPIRVVTHLDVYSVAKVSIVFYLIVLIIAVVASILLWLVADAFGAVDSIQKSIRSLFDLKSFSLHPITIALYASAASAVLAVAGTIANVLAASIYNLISEVVGGIRIGVSADHDPAP